MYTLSKEEKINLLKTDVVKWNTIMIDYDNEIKIDLRWADLCEADLHGANLHGANLHGANLRGSNLHGANLHGANLRGADLHGANLRGADLRVADLDYSCLPLWCGSLTMITDNKQRKQIAFHLVSLIANAKDATDDEINLYNSTLDYANDFHIVEDGDVEKLEKI